MSAFNADINYNRQIMDKELRIGQCFDIVSRRLNIGSREAQLYFVDGLISGVVMEKIISSLTSTKIDPSNMTNDPYIFAAKFVTSADATVISRVSDAATSVLSGVCALFVDGVPNAIMINARDYPRRSIEEPEDDRVLRGSRDGFVETMLNNTALIRRRLRTNALTFERMSVGKSSKTDLVLCYVDGIVDTKLLSRIRTRLEAVKVNSLTLAQEGIAESIVRGQWYNPFPRVRFIDRPDAAAACIAEGDVVVLIDNSPDAIVFPTSFFSFMQNTNDYYFPPIVGTYLRNLRILIFFITLFMTPVWLLLLKNPEHIPQWLEFIKPSDEAQIPIFVQLIIIELIVDMMKLASLNTPTVLSNSFSLVSTLILGDFAVKAHWFLPEVILYMAFVSIASFAQSSFELDYAFKLSRMLTLILTAIFNLWGFIAGNLIFVILLLTTKTACGRPYLYPVIPFNLKGFIALFIRQPINRNNN